YGSLLTGFRDAAQDFLADERLSASVFLDDGGHDFFDALVGREATFAAGTFAPAPDHIARLVDPRIDHLRVQRGAEGAFHASDRSIAPMYLIRSSNSMTQSVVVFTVKIGQ